MKLKNWQMVHVAAVACKAHADTLAGIITAETPNPYKVGDYWNSTFQNEQAIAWDDGRDIALRVLAGSITF